MSNKKTLLNENTIRRFMKLANTEALSNNFLAEEEKYGRKEMNAAAKKAREDAKKKGIHIEDPHPRDIDPMKNLHDEIINDVSLLSARAKEL